MNLTISFKNLQNDHKKIHMFQVHFRNGELHLRAKIHLSLDKVVSSKNQGKPRNYNQSYCSQKTHKDKQNMNSLIYRCHYNQIKNKLPQWKNKTKKKFRKNEKIQKFLQWIIKKKRISNLERKEFLSMSNTIFIQNFISLRKWKEIRKNPPLEDQNIINQNNFH